jgi:hypothetical protein
MIVFSVLFSAVIVMVQAFAETTSTTPFEKFEVTEYNERELSTKLSIQGAALSQRTEYTVEVSENYQLPDSQEKVPLHDPGTNEPIGSYQIKKNRLVMQLESETALSSNLQIELKGLYQENEAPVSIHDPLTKTRIELDQLPSEKAEQKEETSETKISETENTGSSEKEAAPSAMAAPLSSLLFHAELKESEIKDGTDAFDTDDLPGNDSSPTNTIVRSFDTITYPLKITVNDQAGGTLNNIKIKVTGTLGNGLVAGRSNAVFAEHSTSDYTANTVTYEDEYTISSTGNAVTYPIIVNVLGADNGLLLTPEFHIQVLSIDGEDVSGENIQKSFTSITPRKVSSKVSIAPKISSGVTKFASQTIATEGVYDKNHRTVPLGVEMMAVPLPNKTDIKGSAFPKGALTTKLTLEGRVKWDDGTEQALDFDSADRSPLIIDHHNYVVSSGGTLVSGNANTWSNTANVQYKQNQFNDSRNYWAGSKRTDKATYNELNSIWDSGTYGIDGYDLKNDVSIRIQDYQIGADYPVRRADGYAGRTVYGPNEKVFTNQNIDLLVTDDYAYQGRLNPNNEHNTLYYTATVQYIDTDGQVKTSKTEFSIRNEIPGINGALSANFKNPDTGLPFGKYSVANDIDPYGDGQVISGARVMLSGGGNLGDSPSEGGYQYMQKWNTDAFHLTEQDFLVNEQVLQSLAPFGSIGLPVKAKGYWYGISKKTTPNTIDSLKNAETTDYDWFDSGTLISSGRYEEVGAVLVDCHTPVAKTWKYQTGAHKGFYLTTVTEKLGSHTEQQTPNIYVAEIAIFRDSARPLFDPSNPSASKNDPSRYSITEKYPVFNESKYDSENHLSAIQEPVNGHTKFDTLGIVPLKVSNAITSDKPSYRSTEISHWTIADNGLKASKNYNGTDDIYWTVTLPPGISYRYGTGHYGGAALDPVVTTNADGSQTLVWKVTAVSVPEEAALLKNITFDTDFNDLNIKYVNNVAELTAKSVIHTEKDTSDEDMRTSTATVVVSNIGRLGIYQEITPPVEEVNQGYTLNIYPYSTMKGEEKVRGIVPLSKAGNYLNSGFVGDNTLKGITFEIESAQNLIVYLNDALITEKNPNLVDTSQNGWYVYTGSGQDLSKVQTVLYEFQDSLRPNDKAVIQLKLQNKGNTYGNHYRHQAYGNSATQYLVPVESNIVETQVKGRRISGNVWFDKNKDGQPQTGEKWLKNVPVGLYKKVGKDDYQQVTENLRGESLKAIKTDGDGHYCFDYLPSGEYIVTFDYESAPLKDLTVTLFNQGDPETSSKVDLTEQLAVPNNWSTIVSHVFPTIDKITGEVFEQTNLHLGVYKKDLTGSSSTTNTSSTTSSSSTTNTSSKTSSSSTTSTSSSTSSSSTTSTSSSTSSSSMTSPSSSTDSSSKNRPLSGGGSTSQSKKTYTLTKTTDTNARKKLPNTNVLSNNRYLLFGMVCFGGASALLVYTSQKKREQKNK